MEWAHLIRRNAFSCLKIEARTRKKKKSRYRMSMDWIAGDWLIGRSVGFAHSHSAAAFHFERIKEPNQEFIHKISRPVSRQEKVIKRELKTESCACAFYWFVCLSANKMLSHTHKKSEERKKKKKTISPFILIKRWHSRGWLTGWLRNAGGIGPVKMHIKQYLQCIRSFWCTHKHTDKRKRERERLKWTCAYALCLACAW